MLFPPDPVVTLTTDFGTRDPYVAAIKGVLLDHCPGLRIEDLTHEIAPQDITEAALFLSAAVPCFPAGTIHVAVIDPGVGTYRHPIAVAAGGQRFVCPDNGLLTLILETLPLEKAHIIENPEFIRAQISRTFHGRDIFAPAAARLAAGASVADAGPPLDAPHQLDLPKTRVEVDGRVLGRVIHMDHFGNCITNIRKSQIDSDARYHIQIAETTLPALHATYADVPPGTALALVGSSARLEIAVRNGNAQEKLGIQPGALVTLSPA